jgi:parvulin-like peptidyl-prolyl isomerase
VSGITGETAQFVEAALSSNIGEVKGPIVVGNGAVAFQVLEQKKVTEQDLAQNRASFADRLRTEQARQLRSVLVDRLRKSAKVEINDAITRPTTTPAGV